MSDTINTTTIEQETLAFVAGKSAAEIGMAIALMRHYQAGREAAAVPAKRTVGRPTGSKTKRHSASVQAASVPAVTQ